MKRNLLLAISLALVLIMVGVVGCTGDFGFPESSQLPELTESGNIIINQQNTGIWVTGEGVVSVVPDVAVLNLGVETQEKTVAEAEQQAAEAMAAVMAVLDEQGVAEKDIKTQYFSIYPVRSWQNDVETLVGYRVSNIVTVKIREIADTGSIIDAVTQAGGDYTRFNSISLTVDDPTDYYDEVREKAMEDAAGKAKQLAKLAKVDLGNPTYISESNISIPTSYDFYRGGAEMAPVPAPTTSISPGETEIRLTVQVRYGIEG